jgi:hypothetical protein
VNKEHCKSPCGTRTKAVRLIGCKTRQVRATHAGGRESGGGNTDQPGADNLRGSAEKADHEKLNDERGVKPLPVNNSRDGAESGNDCSGRVEGSFCILALEISAPVALETMTRREPRTCLTALDD